MKRTKNKQNDRETTWTRTKIERNKQIDRIIWSAIYRIKWTRTDIKWNEQKDRETTWTAWTISKFLNSIYYLSKIITTT